MLTIGVISLFPEIFKALEYGIVGRACRHRLIDVRLYPLRDWGIGPHQKVDDAPYGGGAGMVLMFEPLAAAIRHAKTEMPNCRVIYLSPQGKRCDQALFQSASEVKQPLLFIAGRYEGIDERIIETFVDEEWSLGDFVLSGGEYAALSMIDAITRLLPDSLGDPESAIQDSFAHGLLDYPHYTKPACIEGLSVPPVLLSGHHQRIASWRQAQALAKTQKARPDLL